MADYMFCEQVGFRILPWELDDLPSDITVFWANVINMYVSARNEQKAKAEGRQSKRRS